jgi:hypothetical protein
LADLLDVAKFTTLNCNIISNFVQTLVEMAVEDDFKKGIRLCKEDFICAAVAVKLM